MYILIIFLIFKNENKNKILYKLLMKLAILALNHIKNKDSVINGTLVQLNNLSLGFSSLGIDVHYISLTNESNKKFEVIDGINFH